jgi:hypothetical protein
MPPLVATRLNYSIVLTRLSAPRTLNTESKKLRTLRVSNPGSPACKPMSYSLWRLPIYRNAGELLIQANQSPPIKYPNLKNINKIPHRLDTYFNSQSGWFLEQSIINVSVDRSKVLSQRSTQFLFPFNFKSDLIYLYLKCSPRPEGRFLSYLGELEMY